METKHIENSQTPTVSSENTLDRQDVEERRALIKAVRAINATALFGENYELTFVLDRETNRPLLRIIDRETREVVRQLPPEYTIRLASAIRQQNSSSGVR